MRRGYELAGMPEFTDNTGRVVVPVLDERCSDYYDAWKEYCLSVDPNRACRHNLRRIAACALDCPSQCAEGVGSLCRTAMNAATGTKPWVQKEGNPYAPFLWRNYEIGEFEYDLVVYRRPKRSVLCKLLCCGG